MGDQEQYFHELIATHRSILPTYTRKSSGFSGTIGPGDILRFEIVGGLPVSHEPIRTVEPDGNFPIGAYYAPKSRVQIAGKTLIEAGKYIESELREIVKNPQFSLTYEGHDDGVVPAAQKETTPLEDVILKPLDTIEVTLGAKMNDAAFPSGTHLIEPDGTIALFNRRLKLADMTEREAGAALRTYMSSQPWLLKAPPSIHVQRRGHAVFSKNERPPVDYRVKPGDALLANSSGSPVEGTRLTVSDDGILTYPDKLGFYELPPVQVEGKTLSEVQQALRAN